jgi:hypothetical protein
MVEAQRVSRGPLLSLGPIKFTVDHPLIFVYPIMGGKKNVNYFFLFYSFFNGKKMSLL